MQTDYRNSTAFSDDERALVARLLKVRAAGAIAIVGFIALIAFSSGPSVDEAPAASAPPVTPDAGKVDAGLSALERGSA